MKLTIGIKCNPDGRHITSDFGDNSVHRQRRKTNITTIQFQIETGLFKRVQDRSRQNDILDRRLLCTFFGGKPNAFDIRIHINLLLTRFRHKRHIRR